MNSRPSIRPELREWILSTTRAGHSVPEVLQLMKQSGYDPRYSDPFGRTLYSRVSYNF